MRTIHLLKARPQAIARLPLVAYAIGRPRLGSSVIALGARVEKTFLITGATKGIGRALSARVAAAGHHVFGLARHPDPAFPGEPVTVDLADPAATRRALDDIARRRAVDGVVNNVGLVGPQRLGAIGLEDLAAVPTAVRPSAGRRFDEAVGDRTRRTSSYQFLNHPLRGFAAIRRSIVCPQNCAAEANERRICMKSSCGMIVAAFASMAVATSAYAADPAYFTRYDDLKMARDKGVLVVEMNSHGSALKFTAHDHETFVDAFYDIGRDRDNRVVILTGAGGDWRGDIDFGSFGNVGDPDVWAKVHDEGEQILQNIANIRVPVICAVEGKACVHSEYCLLANVIVAGEGASFNDLPHFQGGIVPGDGVYTLWAYYVGPGRAQAMLLDPRPVSAAIPPRSGAL